MHASPQNMWFRCTPGACINMSVTGTGEFQKTSGDCPQEWQGPSVFQNVSLTFPTLAHPDYNWIPLWWFRILVWLINSCHRSLMERVIGIERNTDWIFSTSGYLWKFVWFAFSIKSLIWVYCLSCDSFSSKMDTTKSSI